MIHNREGIIERTLREFELLDRLVADLAEEDWELLAPRLETKEPWTVKDVLARTSLTGKPTWLVPSGGCPDRSRSVG